MSQQKQSKLQLLRNLAASASKPVRIPTMIRSVLREQGMDTKGSLSEAENLEWLKSNAIDFEALAASKDRDLWEETQAVARGLQDRANEIVVPAEEKLGYHLGGGGYYALLYFVTRLRRPENILETGVAAGYSSQAFLKALDKNGTGHLYSSDFPYFRLKEPEKYIGILVEESLKGRWTLLVEGDEVNLPVILEKAASIDIFHYDSDKSYSGRAWATSLVEPRLTERSVVIMDDIQDNSYFHDHVKGDAKDDWFVVEFEGKYVGVIGAGAELGLA